MNSARRICSIVVAACTSGLSLTLLGVPAAADADPSAPTYTLSHEPAGAVVGTQVVETYTALDEHGEPIAGVTVGFVRTGPSDETGRASGLTDEDGQVTYAFAGETGGIATVEAMITDESPAEGDQPVPESRATDEVVVGSGEDLYPNLKVMGWSRGSRDLISVTCDVAGGATTTLRAHNERLRSHALNDRGHHTFIVRDRTARQPTRYRVVVAGTGTTRRISATITIR